MPSYSFMITILEASTLVMQGGLMMTGLQNLLFSLYLYHAYQKQLDLFKVLMNAALLVNAMVFAVFFFPVGERCQGLGVAGNLFGHVFSVSASSWLDGFMTISIDALLLLRVLTLSPHTSFDRPIIFLLLSNRFVAAATDIPLSPSHTSPNINFDNCVYVPNIHTGWWYLMSDVACDLYATARNYMVMREAEKTFGKVPFFYIYRNWNVSRSFLVLLTNIIIGFITLFNRLDRSIYLLASTGQFIILSYLMTYDMTVIKTAENLKANQAGHGNNEASQKTLGDEERVGDV
ncbi:hypothetical protein HDU97_009003, partial [Phlyctochytrium planicorne]